MQSRPLPEALPKDASDLAPAKPRSGPSDLLALAAITLSCAILATGMWNWTYDDVFIIFRYARNLADGFGMVYNRGEHYLGTSSPLYTIILALLYLIPPHLDFVILGSIVSTVGLWTGGVLLWLIGKQARTPVAGFVAALLLIGNPITPIVFGGEMHLLVPLVLAAVYCYTRGWGVATAILLSLALLTRQDSAVLVGSLLLHHLVVRRRIPAIPVLAFVVVAFPWFLYSWAFFGSPLPATLQAKIVQTAAGWTAFLPGAWNYIIGVLTAGPQQPLIFLLAVCGVAALALAWRAKRPVTPWVLLLVWGALFTAGYSFLGVAFYTWYAVPAMVAMLVLMALGVQLLVNALTWLIRRVTARSAVGGGLTLAPRNRPQGHFAEMGATLMVLLLLAWPLSAWIDVQVGSFIRTHENPATTRDAMYRDVGNWLAKHGANDSAVAYLEVGRIGYYSNMKVVDMLGLVTPGVVPQVRWLNFDWPVQQYKPEYYVAYECFAALLAHIDQESWFQAAYEPVATFEGMQCRAKPTSTLTIYRLKQGALIPDPLEPIAAQQAVDGPVWLAEETRAHWPGQTFTSPSNNLAGIALFFAQQKTPTRGTVILHLRAAPGDATDIRRIEVPATIFRWNTWETLRFEPIPDSAGKSYFLTIETRGIPHSADELAIGFHSTDLLAGGRRYEGEQPVRGDFGMRLYAASP